MEQKVLDTTYPKLLVNLSGHVTVVTNPRQRETNLVLDTGRVKICGRNHHLKKQPVRKAGWQNLTGGRSNANVYIKTKESEEAA
tara:strand:+ start:318 stop:569 length:252 start_codon:yes stop_codon:yes gene_type:complete